MRVKVNGLQPGYILKEDVMGLTPYPLVQKNTILTDVHLEVLNAFQIDSILVEPLTIEGNMVKIEQENSEEQKQTQSPVIDEFLNLYIQSIEAYGREFQRWKSGIGVDMAKMRQIILPLLRALSLHTDKLYTLHHYSTKENYLFHHAVATAVISGEIARTLKYDKGLVIQTALAGLLSDCGMAKLNGAILDQNRALTEYEYKKVKNHTLYSYNMVKDESLLKPIAKLAIFQHHERLDGSGYPLQEKGKRIHQISQIVGIADTYHAMTSERLYRKKQAPFKVLEIIQQDFFGKFELQVVKALLSTFANLRTGSIVKLSNKQKGSIIFTKNQSPTRPLVKIEETNEIIDLEKNRGLYIEEVMML
ncbi:HD-GYP domain-containing protein (c-di-GMP phosphodiesterase class II) [Oikeobacillus pervagus]|uniref:HD-GYP domain-containing protein (C-di-GMP phosphodiesterase class II) n=1 Tax=Oikeobacillus pervagus TaxID=1325931 RepID=A0AAJ1WLU5_9BACI|nr:HD domain-containing phosphohydrolase [Oikeobacillus pervagus]MDQ0216601.1 HD-GYP domain-containing protein (c-di-GMP phosphodiesterase class II) [Oikeobacillus pervagus]